MEESDDSDDEDVEYREWNQKWSHVPAYQIFKKNKKAISNYIVKEKSKEKSKQKSKATVLRMIFFDARRSGKKIMLAMTEKAKTKRQAN